MAAKQARNQTYAFEKAGRQIFKIGGPESNIISADDDIRLLFQSRIKGVVSLRLLVNN